MSAKLDTLIDNYIKLKKETILQEVEEEEIALFIDSTKKQLKKEIQEEIEVELKEEVLREAQNEIEKKAGLKRIEEFRKLAIDGFAVAVFVGLFVNQTTELIGYFKGTAVLNSMVLTLVFAFIFILICIGIFVWKFLQEFIKLLKKEYNDEAD